jgi:hypothetical protein
MILIKAECDRCQGATEKEYTKEEWNVKPPFIEIGNLTSVSVGGREGFVCEKCLTALRLFKEDARNYRDKLYSSFWNVK